jgi:methionine-rich copper-binding protein CopC
MVRKIEGLSGIDGGQMPLGETPLPTATIDAIRQWITNGAPNSPAAAPAMFAVQTTVPADKAVVTAPPAQILVAFTQEVDASLVNDTTVTVERVLGPAQDSTRAVAASRALVQSNGAVLLITPSKPLEPGAYRVTLRGAGGGALANLNAATLGSTQSFEFTVEPAL